MATFNTGKSCPGRDDMDNCGSTWYEKALGDDMQPVWKCTNCCNETPRRVQKRHTHATPSQLRVLEQVRTKLNERVHSEHGQSLGLFFREPLSFEMNDHGTMRINWAYENKSNGLIGQTGQIFVGRGGKIDTKYSSIYRALLDPGDFPKWDHLYHVGKD